MVKRRIIKRVFVQLLEKMKTLLYHKTQE